MSFIVSHSFITNTSDGFLKNQSSDCCLGAFIVLPQSSSCSQSDGRPSHAKHDLRATARHSSCCSQIIVVSSCWKKALFISWQGIFSRDAHRYRRRHESGIEMHWTSTRTACGHVFIDVDVYGLRIGSFEWTFIEKCIVLNMFH